MDIERIMGELPSGGAKRLAVVAAADGHVLQSVAEAKRLGIVSPTLFGDDKEIRGTAAAHGVNLDGMDIVGAATDEEAAALAVRFVHEGQADMLMKGLLQTSTLLRAVLDREHGLRKQKVLSHVSVLQSPTLQRRLLLTDAAMVMYPDLDTKVAMIHNAVHAARGLGIALPKVAALAAVEVVNPQMQATVDAALLAAMNRRGQIKNCVVDGPLAMDLALSQEAALQKKVDSPVAGAADILLLHNIDVANSVLKTFTQVGGCLFGGVVMGAAAPIVLTSRSDSVQSKLFSIACAVAIRGFDEGGVA